MGTIWSAMNAAITAFREEWANQSFDLEVGRPAFASREARWLRYSMAWSQYEGTAYQQLHAWSRGRKQKYDLYRSIRNIYNPTYRVAEFWVAHLYMGTLDPAMGDGSERPTSVPIETPKPNDELRQALAILAADSKLGQGIDRWCRQGVIAGDTAWRVNDHPDAGKVYLEPIDTGTLADVTFDEFGNVKGYVIKESRNDPTIPAPTLWNAGNARPQCQYWEVCYRDGDEVVYETYKNGSLYAWNGDEVGAKWSVPYGFVPLVVSHHIQQKPGQHWGVGELHGSASAKIRECDDLASKLSDQIRKMSDPAWFFAGVKASSPVSGQDKRSDNNREASTALYSPDPAARAQALVVDMDIAAASAHILSILRDLEADYPELRLDSESVTGDASGKALREVRKKAESKVQKCRSSYDDALRRAMQMAVAIGGYRGYEGYEPFSLDSFSGGDLDFRIIERPAFDSDPTDAAELEILQARQVKAWTDLGLPLHVALARAGWTADEISRLSIKTTDKTTPYALDVPDRDRRDEPYDPVA